MTQQTVVVTGLLPDVAGATVDFEVDGFGAPDAAIFIANGARSDLNPVAGVSNSLGFWDSSGGQRSVGISTADGVGVSRTYRAQRTDRVLLICNTTSTALLASYSCTLAPGGNGVRLTMEYDATTATRYATIILIRGVSAKVTSIVPNATLSGFADSPTMPFEPKAVIALSIGYSGITPETSSVAHSTLGVGVATKAGNVQRYAGWGSVDNLEQSLVTASFRTDSIAGQTYNGTDTWRAGVSAWNADSITVQTLDGASGGDEFYALMLGGDDLCVNVGTLKMPTSPGVVEYSTPGVKSSAVLMALGNGEVEGVYATGASDGFAIGVADNHTQAAYSSVDDYNANTTITNSLYDGSNAIHTRYYSTGNIDQNVGTVLMGDGKFFGNYSTAWATGNKLGWFLAFGEPLPVQLENSAVGNEAATSSHAINWSGAFTATAGRLLVLRYGNTGGAISFTLPSDWTLIHHNTDSARNQSGGWAYKVADGGETGLTVGTSASAVLDWIIEEWSGLDASSPLDQKAENGSNNTTASSTISTGTTAALSTPLGYAMSFFIADGAGALPVIPTFTGSSAESNRNTTGSCAMLAAHKWLDSMAGFGESITNAANDQNYGSVAVFKRRIVSLSALTPTTADTARYNLTF